MGYVVGVRQLDVITVLNRGWPSRMFGAVLLFGERPITASVFTISYAISRL